ncbi:MAG: squalene/phytoene synthase family protein, partial [Candidatus Thioglobus sp.]
MKTSVQAAFRHCHQLALAHYENFPVASRLISAKKRKYVWAIYAFARTADDLADKEESLARLAEWDEKLDTAVSGEPTEPIFIALKQTIEECQIPPSLLHDLVTAFRRDVQQNRHETFDALLDYCHYSANPIGRLVLLIHGYRDDQLFYWSDKICT